MGVSTNGQICFGILFPEEFEFPWGNTEKDNIDTWWIEKVHNYKPPFDLYDKKGAPIGNPTRERTGEWWEHRSAFEKAHPLPVKLVNYCSLSVPQYIVACPSTIKFCLRGYPAPFLPSDLQAEPKEIMALGKFIREYLKVVLDQKDSPEPKWWLSSYWDS